MLNLAAMNSTTTSPPRSETRSASAWAGAFARIYDPVLWLSERRVLRERRREILAQARGLTVELGAGTGLNLAHYPPALERLVLTEPDAAMRKHLGRRVAHADRPASVLDASAEELPFADGAVDTIVSTLVLCTVERPETALDEIARVLAPGGQLLFIEHVRAHSRTRASWQDRLAAPWRAFAGGCHCNRPTLTLMAQQGFELDIAEAAWRGMPAIVKPLVYGRARFAAGSGSSRGLSA
jgi:SAM-dependent methyltransferase